MIQSLEHQNRALNADIVAVEVLPKAQWIQNYKHAPVDTCLDDDAPAAKLDEEEDAAPESTNLMEQINMSQNQVTARVVGIIKKLPKTYGGSILTADMMLDTT